MVPCGMTYTLYNGEEATIRDDCIYEKQKVIDYLGLLQVTAYYNDKHFHQDKYGENRLSTYSTFKQIVTSPATASWIGVEFNRHRLVDETDFLQLGNIDEIEYDTFSFIDAQPSTYLKWPTKTNSSLTYKLAGLWIEFGQTLTETERQTYSFLDLLGDVGGLFDGFRYIVAPIIAPFAAFTMRSQVLTQAFRYKPEEKDGSDDD